MGNKIKQLLQLQSSFNEKVNPEWVKASYNWKTALFIESAELVDSLDWKWWKYKGSSDWKNAKIEVVDLLHFFISHLISEVGVIKAEELLEKSFSKYSFGFNRSVELIEDSVLSMVAAIHTDDLEESLNWLAFISGLLFSSFDELYSMYITKNILNTLRQDKGYKSGLYIKEWEIGKEDNVVVMELFSKNMDLSFEDFYKVISDYYDNEVSNAG